LPKKKPTTEPLASKVMGTVSWDSEGCIMVNFLEKGEIINAACYIQTLNQLFVKFVKNVQRRKLSSFNTTMQGLTLHI
jgi:hypothetical protein